MYLTSHTFLLLHLPHVFVTPQAKLQSSMLEQLSAFRDKLGLVEDENRKLRHALTTASQPHMENSHLRAYARTGAQHSTESLGGRGNYPSLLQSALRVGLI